MNVGDEWFVLVVEKGHEMSSWFSAENAALAYASTQGKRLKVEKIRRIAERLRGRVLAVVNDVVGSSPVAIRMTRTALPITSAGRFGPLGPIGIDFLFRNDLAV
jgi:hypothetical protein